MNELITFADTNVKRVYHKSKSSGKTSYGLDHKKSWLNNLLNIIPHLFLYKFKLVPEDLPEVYRLFIQKWVIDDELHFEPGTIPKIVVDNEYFDPLETMEEDRDLYFNILKSVQDDVLREKIRYIISRTFAFFTFLKQILETKNPLDIWNNLKSILIDPSYSLPYEKFVTSRKESVDYLDGVLLQKMRFSCYFYSNVLKSDTLSPHYDVLTDCYVYKIDRIRADFQVIPNGISTVINRLICNKSYRDQLLSNPKIFEILYGIHVFGYEIGVVQNGFGFVPFVDMIDIEPCVVELMLNSIAVDILHDEDSFHHVYETENFEVTIVSKGEPREIHEKTLDSLQVTQQKLVIQDIDRILIDNFKKAVVDEDPNELKRLIEEQSKFIKVKISTHKKPIVLSPPSDHFEIESNSSVGYKKQKKIIVAKPSLLHSYGEKFEVPTIDENVFGMELKIMFKNFIRNDKLNWVFATQKKRLESYLNESTVFKFLNVNKIHHITEKFFSVYVIGPVMVYFKTQKPSVEDLVEFIRFRLYFLCVALKVSERSYQSLTGFRGIVNSIVFDHDILKKLSDSIETDINLGEFFLKLIYNPSRSILSQIIPFEDEIELITNPVSENNSTIGGKYIKGEYYPSKTIWNEYELMSKQECLRFIYSFINLSVTEMMVNNVVLNNVLTLHADEKDQNLHSEISTDLKVFCLPLLYQKLLTCPLGNISIGSPKFKAFENATADVYSSSNHSSERLVKKWMSIFTDEKFGVPLTSNRKEFLVIPILVFFSNMVLRSYPEDSENHEFMHYYFTVLHDKLANSKQDVDFEESIKIVRDSLEKIVRKYINVPQTPFNTLLKPIVFTENFKSKLITTIGFFSLNYPKYTLNKDNNGIFHLFVKLVDQIQDETQLEKYLSVFYEFIKIVEFEHQRFSSIIPFGIATRIGYNTTKELFTLIGKMSTDRVNGIGAIMKASNDHVDCGNILIAHRKEFIAKWLRLEHRIIEVTKTCSFHGVLSQFENQLLHNVEKILLY